MNNETTRSDYISNLTANSSSAMVNEFDFGYKFEKELNEETTKGVSNKVKVILDGFNSFLSIVFIPNSATEYLRESFIGIISDEEAEKMKRELTLFKKRFNDDFARKNKILFGY